MITMTNDEYLALTHWAKLGAFVRAEGSDFYDLRKRIDIANGVLRFSLTVRYPARPEAAPISHGITPDLTIKQADFDRVPTRDDAIAMLGTYTGPLSLVQVSADPNSTLGFYELEAFPW